MIMNATFIKEFEVTFKNVDGKSRVVKMICLFDEDSNKAYNLMVNDLNLNGVERFQNVKAYVDVYPTEKGVGMRLLGLEV